MTERIDESLLRVEISQRIKECRMKRDMAQWQLAIRADVSKSFMSELEAGVTTSNALVYIRLAKVLQVSVQFLLTGEEPNPEMKLLTENLDRLQKLVIELNNLITNRHVVL